MRISDHIVLWNHVLIRVMDVRRMLLEPGEVMRGYRVPTSAFLYVTGGSGQLHIDGVESLMKRFHVLHVGKGIRLDIEAVEPLEYFMVLYKATLPLPSRFELVNLMERENPFQLRYSLSPKFPISWMQKLEHMHQIWQAPSPLDKLKVKTLFYQLLYELVEQLHEQGVDVIPPDLVSQAVYYMEEHYQETVTLEELADTLECTTRQLLRLFKNQMDTSPIEYLIGLRLNKAKELLVYTDKTLKEISESVGYTDSYYFSRIFKKQEGVSPKRFKELHAWEWRRNNPFLLSRYPIVAGGLRRYSRNGYENHYQSRGEGDSQMYKKSRAWMTAMVVICFTLLLSACSTGATTSPNATSSVTPIPSASSTSTPAANKEADAPRVIKHAMGETTIKGTPSRVVILTNEGTEALLAVGVKPVGAVMSWLGEPWYDHIKNDMQNVTVVGDELQPNLELIASLKPDLIIGNKVRQEKIYDQLKQIAPTVFAADLVGDWKVNFKLYSEAVNKKDEGEKAMAAFDKRVAEVKGKLGSKAATKVSLVRFSASQVRIYQKQTFAGVLLNQLGIARPESQDKENFIEVLNKENIAKMDGDVLFYFVTEAKGKTDAANVVKEWQNDPLFKNLNVTKTNKVIQVDEGIWNSAGGYKAANLLLDELIKYFDVK
ncbi:ABC transporter substrate-binding protein [Paenibacillus sp. CGMCC 1.16610]|uniref:ABC transporter substrate-binding protein n=1 Tax=Paenibacillus anseongense TaxID=2682845 RepID=A0ABW9UHS7_9BACL|nr:MULTISPECIES: ABC transporter substrate-binding protein [Paenibacillus]MBA2936746.1 ABC transporter substrate-binding protein [Paenibacillus sp. CGMCC 1.16610]MVQ39739.1 ABC transporter substrate-binding protein [Paenibacillus anseongense]